MNWRIRGFVFLMSRTVYWFAFFPILLFTWLPLQCLLFFPVFFLLYDKYWWYEYCPSGSQLLLRLEQFTGKAKGGRQLDWLNWEPTMQVHSAHNGKKYFLKKQSDFSPLSSHEVFYRKKFKYWSAHQMALQIYWHYLLSFSSHFGNFWSIHWISQIPNTNTKY